MESMRIGLTEKKHISVRVIFRYNYWVFDRSHSAFLFEIQRVKSSLGIVLRNFINELEYFLLLGVFSQIIELLKIEVASIVASIYLLRCECLIFYIYLCLPECGSARQLRSVHDCAFKLNFILYMLIKIKSCSKEAARK